MGWGLEIYLYLALQFEASASCSQDSENKVPLFLENNQ
jgi:hypothetical protein